MLTDDDELEPCNTITHIAGMPVTLPDVHYVWGGIPRVIQRCAICGSVLVDTLHKVGPQYVIVAPHQACIYEPSRLIRLDGTDSPGITLPHTGKLPHDNCLNMVDQGY